MSNLIPDKAKQILGLVFSLAVVILMAMSEWADMGKAFVLWSHRVSALLVVVSNVLGLSVPGIRSKVVPGATALLAVLLLTACPKPYDAAWRSLDSIQKAKHLTAQQLAQVADTKHKACLKSHGPKTPAYADCIKPTRAMLTQWKTNVRPAVNSAVNITATAISIAERAKQDPNVKWLDLLRPAVCSLLRVAKSWGHYYADKGAAVLSALTAFEGVICHE